MITKIIKRDGRKVTFNIDKMANAIFKAAQSVGGSDYQESMDIACRITENMDENFRGTIPTVEQVQDIVEKTLIEEGHAKTAKAYILYRYERTRSREMKTNLMCVLNELTFSPAKEHIFLTSRFFPSPMVTMIVAFRPEEAASFTSFAFPLTPAG